MAPMPMLTWWLCKVRPRCPAWPSTKRAVAVLFALAPIGVASSCQAILGIDEGKPRTTASAGSGGGGGAGQGGADPGGADQGGTGNLGGGGAAPAACIEPSPAAGYPWGLVIGGSDGLDMARAVAIGPDGTIAVVGHFASSTIATNFPDVSLGTLDLEGTDQNGYLVVLDGTPSLLWARKFWSDGAVVDPVAVAYSGNEIVVAGNYYQYLFSRYGDDGSTSTLVHDHPGMAAGFVMRFSPDGLAVTGSVSLGASEGVSLAAMAADEHGDVSVAGRWLGTLDLGGQLHASADLGNALVVKYLSEGLGSGGLASFASSELSSADAIASLPGANQVVVGGQFVGDLTAPPDTSLTAVTGHHNGWLARLELAGAAVTVSHSLQYGDADGAGGGLPVDSNAQVRAIASGAADAVAVSVCFSGPMSFGEETVLPGASGTDCLIALLDASFLPDGLLPRPTYDGILQYNAKTVAAGPSGTYAFGGNFIGGALDFGAGHVLPESGASDAFLVRAHDDTQYHYALSILDEGSSDIAGLAMDGCGALVAVGHFDSSERPAAVWSPDKAEGDGAVYELARSGGIDGFVLALGPSLP